MSDNSLSGLVSTLAPTALYAAVWVGIFLVLRKSQRRYYAPRTYLGTLSESQRTPELPKGLFNWFPAFFKLPDSHALLHQSLDAYLFIRFIKITVVMAFVGCLITWPILFPVNATGGGGQVGLNVLSYTNVDVSTSSGKNRLYAHALVAWVYYGFLLFMICRETIYYINLRQAFLLAPMNANRISSRTVLFTSVPEPYLDEGKLRRVFGKGVKNLWIKCDSKEVDEIVDNRDKAAYKLEAAEIKLIKTALKARFKASKKGATHEEGEDNVATDNVADAESGSIAARWVPTKKRPTHKTGMLGLFGPKVDTIDWARTELAHLIPEAEKAQLKYRSSEYKKQTAVFIEFHTQTEAQAAFQSLAHHQALHMSPRYIGITPSEVVWKSLSIPWWQRVIRRFAVQGFIAALIIFWAIPVALVGIISNVNNLESISFLSWIKDIPSVILGVVTGLLPSVMLAILMSLVPIIMRLCAKLSGEPSLARVELFTQNAYFAFQVIQVFLVVTLSSAATSVATSIVNDPSSALSLLANDLPKASNFYISFFILQGLALASSVLAQVIGFVIFNLLYKILGNTPRKMYMKWTTLSALSWGSLLPVFTNIVVIAITYSTIAPLLLGFATIGLLLYYVAYRYNVLFVTNANIDTKGLIYPRALQQLFTGIYLSELCLTGLFAISLAWGPLVLMVVFLVFTILFQIAMNGALGPLMAALPKTLEVTEDDIRADIEAAAGKTATASADGSYNNNSNSNNEKADIETTKDSSDGTTTTTPAGTTAPLPPAPHAKPSMLTKWLKPHIYTDYATLRRFVPAPVDGEDDVGEMYPGEADRDAYYPPAVTSETPLLWIPRDEAGMSRQAVAQSSKVIPMTDEGATFSEKGAIEWDGDASGRPPVWREPIRW